MLQKLNESLLAYFNSFASNGFIESIVSIFADAPIFFLPLFFIATWIFYGIKKQRNSQEEILFIFYSVILGILITLIIQQFIQLERPENYLKGAGKLLLNHVPDASFPSDHATVSFAFLTALFLAHYRKTFWIFLPFVITMNLSRIIAGVHWPFDIIAGMFIGITASIIVFAFLKKTSFIKKINSSLIKISLFLKL
ncbi:phosphatase PAP2 family protein [Candidatus Gracilibacteria bacterium]|nr:phosphatase PAP2 family protein [Candidatus Gracilibacteria bacterium]NUJ98987.1 phosphatase PAP2 family protein [Candidatus Gracilibacteria bacterium]